MANVYRSRLLPLYYVGTMGWPHLVFIAVALVDVGGLLCLLCWGLLAHFGREADFA
jgi:hypothetical protein